MMNWKETKCGKCKIQRARPVCNSCFSYDKFIPIAITNADRIRSMSDEELAEFMANKGGYIACNQCDFFNHDEEKCESPSGWLCTKGYAEALIHKWLQSDVEE